MTRATILWSVLGTLCQLVGAIGHCDRQVAPDVLLFGGTNVGVPIVDSSGDNGWQTLTAGTNTILYSSNQLFRVPQSCGESIQIAGLVSFSNSGTSLSPLGLDEDPVYGYGTIGFNDYTGWQFEIWLTNAKVYALYARLPTTQSVENYYKSFTFLVPIADRQPDNVDLYEISLEAEAKSVSYRMNGYELLRIRPTGTSKVDSKFMLANFGGYWDIKCFPDVVFAVAGTATNGNYNGIPNPACQRALFSQCLDNIFDASKTYCQYAPLPLETDFSSSPVINIEELSVAVVWNIKTCPEWTCNPNHKRGNILGSHKPQ